MRGRPNQRDIRARAAFSGSSDEARLIASRKCSPSSAFGTFSPRKKRGGRRRSMGKALQRKRKSCSKEATKGVRNAS